MMNLMRGKIEQIPLNFKKKLIMYLKKLCQNQRLNTVLLKKSCLIAPNAEKSLFVQNQTWNATFSLALAKYRVIKIVFCISDWPTLCCIMHMIKYYEVLGLYMTISTISVTFQFLRNFPLRFFEIQTQFRMLCNGIGVLTYLQIVDAVIGFVEDPCPISVQFLRHL